MLGKETYASLLAVPLPRVGTPRKVQLLCSDTEMTKLRQAVSPVILN